MSAEIEHSDYIGYLNSRADAHTAAGTHLAEIACKIADHRSAERELNAGQDVFSASRRSEELYYLADGWVALYDLLEDGRRQILQFALPGALLGLQSADEAMATYGAQALNRATVWVISACALNALVAEHPQIGIRVALMIARDQSLTFDHLTSIGRRSARERVARLLLELFLRYRAQSPDCRTELMPLPLTQEHIADATGLTNVHVNRVLGELRKQGIVHFHYRRLSILDLEKLMEAAGIDPRKGPLLKGLPAVERQ